MNAEVLVLEAPNSLTAREIELPELSDGQAVLKVDACGLCGSDHEMFSGAMPAALPLVPGHEVVGTVEQATPGFLESHTVQDGDRVALEVFQRCGECENCLAGAYQLCRRHGLRDSYGNTPLSVSPGLWGGYATRLILTHDSLIHRVPDGMDSAYATLFNPLGAGVRWGTVVPEMEAGDVVVVLGPGLRGLSAVAAAAVRGAGFVMLTGGGPRDHERLELGRLLGADEVVDVSQADAKALLKSRTGGLADVVIDVTAAAPAAFLQSLDLVRPGGTVVVAGTRGTHVVKEFNPDRIVFKEIRLLGARGVDGSAYSEALTMLANDDRFKVLPRDTVSLGVGPVADLLDRMARSEQPPLHGVIVP